MASTKIVEPYVGIRENIHATPELLNIDGTTNVGGVIVAPAGPRLSYVAGPKDFLEKYTVDGEIPRNADITFINAYYLSFSAGLVLVRSMNTTAVQGLYFESTEQMEVKILLNNSTEGLWGISIMGTYYWTNGSNKNFSDFVENLSDLTDDDGEYIYSETFINSIKAMSNTQKYCTSFNDIADDLTATLSKTMVATAEYSAKVGGIIVSGLDVTPQILNVNPALNVQIVSNVVSSSTNKKGFKANKVFYKDNVALTEKEYLGIGFGENGIDGNWAFTYGTMAYYHGAIDKSMYEDYSLKQVDTMDDIASSISGINGMTAVFLETPTDDEKEEIRTSLGEYSTDYKYLKVNFSKGNRLFFGEDATSDPESATTQGTIELVQAEEVAESIYSKMIGADGMLFSLYPNQPYDSDLFKVTFTPDEGDLFQMTLFNGKENNTYNVSLFPDTIDQNGANAFIENINAVDSDFTIITNPDIPEATLREVTPKLTQVFAFGDSGLDLSASKRTISKINALYELEDQEIYDIEYLAPFGETNLQFIKNYVYVGKKNYWLTPVDIPYDKTNANSIKGYFLNIDLTSNAIGMGPFDKNTGLTGWMIYIACSTLYYQKIMQNKAAGSEYAPCFDETNGILDFTNPVYMLGKTDREKLLNFKAPVNFLIFNQRLNVYYLNDNRTHQSENNVVSEENNRRLVNRVNKDAKKLMQKFKGLFNTVTTRQNVESMFYLYFSNNIMNQNYHPVEVNVVCNDRNNTTDIINANKMAVKLQVRLTPSTKFIDILDDVYPLGVDFES